MFTSVVAKGPLCYDIVLCVCVSIRQLHCSEQFPVKAFTLLYSFYAGPSVAAVTVVGHCQCEWVVRICKGWRESESDIASTLIHRESNLMFTLSAEDLWKRFGCFMITRWSIS